MTTKQQIEMRQSETREKINALLSKDTKSDEEMTELRSLSKVMQDSEVELRASIAAETEVEQRVKELEPDAELRERVALRSKASLGRFLQSFLGGRLPSGPEAELVAASGVDTGANIPLELWDVGTKVEMRADAVTAAPSTVGVNFDRVEPKVFASSIASKLMIDMPRVKSGTFTTGTINAGLTASSRTKGDAQESTAATFTVQSSTVKSVSARLSITIEDIAAIGAGNFESALRENLSLALSAELDNQIINGNGTAPNLTGMFKRLTDPSTPATGVETWSRFASETCRSGRRIVGERTFRFVGGGWGGYLPAGLFHVSRRTDAEESAASYAKRTMAGFWTNARMPPKAAHLQQGILCRKGRSMMGAGEGIRLSVIPHWGMVSIDDLYTDSASGKRHFTAHVLVGNLILTQPEAYEQICLSGKCLIVDERIEIRAGRTR